MMPLGGSGLGDSEDVAVRVLDEGDLVAIHRGDTPLIGLQRLGVVLLEGDSVSDQLVDRRLDIGDVPAGQRRSRRLGARGRIDVKNGPVATRIIDSPVASLLPDGETELALVE